MSFNPNLDKSTYLSQVKTTGTIIGPVVDGPQFWLPIETQSTATKTSNIISYLIPSAIVFGVVYIVFCDGKTR